MRNGVDEVNFPQITLIIARFLYRVYSAYVSRLLLISIQKLIASKQTNMWRYGNIERNI